MSGIKPVTLDILDASIPDEFNRWQGYSDEVRFAHYKETVRTDPTSWTRHRPDDWAFTLPWQEFRYADVKDGEKLKQVIASDLPGIYIFTFVRILSYMAFLNSLSMSEFPTKETPAARCEKD